METIKQEIFVVEEERRDWRKRTEWCIKNRKPVVTVTRRYLMMVKNPVVRNVIKKNFRTTANHSGRHEDIFYCITGSSNRRKKEFIKSLFYFFRKNLDAALCDEIVVLEGINATKGLMESFMDGSREGDAPEVLRRHN